MGDEEEFVRTQDNQWSQGCNGRCELFRSKWQHWWFWGRPCIHNIWAKWCVIFKILVLFFAAGPRKFINITVEF
jgi:hypothetical protein